MNGNNQWANEAIIWSMTKQSAKDFEGASKALKSMVEPDVAEAHGHGIRITRAKNGNLTIREVK